MDERIKSILDFIENNLNRIYALDELSKMACLSPAQFHKVFKKETGRTPFKFIEEIKMNKAHHCLIHENHSVHDLTEMLGYNDYETFSRAFKKHFHFSPDDLKSIASNIKKGLTIENQGDFFIASFKGIESDEDLVKELEQTMQENNISIEEIKQAKIFKITPKSELKTPAKKLIKNKFEISSGEKIWESLIQKK